MTDISISTTAVQILVFILVVAAAYIMTSEDWRPKT